MSEFAAPKQCDHSAAHIRVAAFSRIFSRRGSGFSVMSVNAVPGTDGHGLVPAEGFEPPTYGLQNRCTTTVLSRQSIGREL